jgi:succinyl-CoA synthetase beta subunit
MKLYEHEGKQLLRSLGISTPDGDTIRRPEDLDPLLDRIGTPVVLKAQLLRGGRGRAGVVRFADTRGEAIGLARDLLGREVGEERVETLLVERKIPIDRELYAGVTIDFASGGPVLLISGAGGVDVEEAAGSDPRFQRAPIDPLHRPHLHEILARCKRAGVTGAPLRPVAETVCRLVQAYFQFDALTAEINPLILAADGRVYAADAKFELDDSALYRLRLPFARERGDHRTDPYEAEAARLGLAYVRTGEGHVGVIAGGAGLCMASMDAIAAGGGKATNFLDLGGGASREKTAAALRMVLKTPGVHGVLMNLFGGINNCEIMAAGIADVVAGNRPAVPILVKMRGHSQEEGWRTLESLGIPVVKHGTTEEAVAQLLAALDRRTGSCRS